MKLKWSGWGRTLALAGGYWAINGGIVDLFYKYNDGYQYIVGAYSIFIGILIIAFLWPFKFLGPILIVANFNTLPLGILLLAAGPFCCTLAPTLVAGVVIFLAGIFFVIGGILREKNLSLDEVKAGWPCCFDAPPPRRGGGD
ncbi:hypothetical protein QOT17_023532 [Balamuthia mandrillaris]